MNFNPAVVFDACVLYPAPLRDILLELAGRGQALDFFRAKWTHEIHDEWMRNLLDKRPDLTSEQLSRTRDLMNKHVEDCLVTDYQHRIESLSLPDENDRHVLAAAIECRAEIIVTANIGDSPAQTLASTGVTPMTAGDFISDFLKTYELAGEAVFEELVRAIKGRLKNPPMNWNQYFECLLRIDGNELPNTVQRLRTIIPDKEIATDDQVFSMPGGT
jgi:predicted nucleic acid-binding protein